MALRIGINGLGRIGRQVLRAWYERRRDAFEIVAVNDLAPADLLAHLLSNDSEYGHFPAPVGIDGDTLTVGEHAIRVTQTREPGAIDWRGAGVEAVVESTGLFTDGDRAREHLKGGARKVVISANGRGPHWTLIYGINTDQYDPSEHHVIAAGSCTTNCVVPMARVLHDSFGIRHGFLTTVHSYTANQNLLDGPHRDWRRARGAAQNIIPTSTGAARAVGEAIPELQGRIDGLALRVPTPTVSLSDLVTEMERPVTVEAVNEAFEEAAGGWLKGVLYVEPRPLVSTDFKGHPGSSIIDSPSTEVVDGTMAKTLSWYDNEWGYASRIVDICAMLAERGVGPRNHS
jgi:glyceraldehyde 3-phosphate dehydrogenase